MLWQVKGQYPIGSSSMPIVDVYIMSEKVIQQSIDCSCQTYTELITHGWHSDLGRVYKPDIPSGWICV